MSSNGDLFQDIFSWHWKCKLVGEILTKKWHSCYGAPSVNTLFDLFSAKSFFFFGGGAIYSLSCWRVLTHLNYPEITSNFNRYILWPLSDRKILTICDYFSFNCCCNTAFEFCPDTVSIVGAVGGISRLQTDGLNKSWRGKLSSANSITL